MSSFLSTLAQQLISTYGTDLSQVTLVFPNKRASLFLNEHLTRLGVKPKQIPTYTTISDLFQSLSDLELADPIKLICDLHKSFVKCTGINMSLDHFYGWGQILLADFDDVDKHLAPAERVFANLRNIHEYDDVSYLSQQQKDIIRKFFSNFNESHNSELKQRFLSLWSHLYDIYLDFNTHLTAQNLTYEGSLSRQVIEQSMNVLEPNRGQVLSSPNTPHEEVFRDCKIFGTNIESQIEEQSEERNTKCCLSVASSLSGSENITVGLRDSARLCRLLPEGRKNFGEGRICPTEKYVFAGFNLLLPVEQSLIDLFGENATLIQDTDEETPKEISIISAPTNNIQARYVSTWLKENNRIAAGSKTAIVLADESLLQTVIHAIPPEVPKLNITTGYPLSQTTAAQGDWSFPSPSNPHEEVFRDCKIFGTNIESQIAEQSEERNTKCCLSEASSLSGSENITVGLRARTILSQKEDSVVPLKKHSARGGTTSQRSALPLATEGTQELFERNYTVLKSPLEQEAFYRIHLILDRLQALIDSGDLEVSDATLHRLLTQIIASTTIPFHGEPIEGIQIMGVLETRNLDFDHVLLLSCNEGNLPKGINDTSFIPYSIRKAYNLTTADHKVDIYHNYFRRLLQRASDVTILYNNSTNDGKTGEMSQFMLQLLVESPHPITLKTLQAGQQPSWSQPLPVNKTPELIEILRQRFAEKPLSPSALSLYLRCPLQFFYRYAAGLDEYEEDSPLDSRLFGTIFHKAAHLLYSTFMGVETSMDQKEEEISLLKNIPHEEERRARTFLKGISSSSSVDSKVEIIRAVDQAIKLELFHLEDPMAPMPPLNGLQLINREVIIKYLHQLLEVDRHLAPFTILALEAPLNSECGQILPFENVLARRASSCGMFSERKNLSTVNVGGVVDRIDLITLPDGTECIRVVDYKTSNTRLKPLPDVAAIFDPANIKYHSDYYLQSIFYSCLVDNSAFLNQREDSVVPLKKHSARGGTTSQDVFERDNTVRPVSPCLLFIQHAGTDNYDPTLILGKTPITDVTEIKDEFMHHLTNLITEIFDPNTPFLPTEERTRCKSCPFHALCQS